MKRMRKRDNEQGQRDPSLLPALRVVQPKFNSRRAAGSRNHSKNIAEMININTGYIKPSFARISFSSVF